jgi:GNAT superfamily N-acetyltransferase
MSTTASITINYLQMTSESQFRPSSRCHVDYQVHQVRIPSPEYSRFLYTSVGAKWKWYERLVWTREQWLAWLNRPGQETWVGYLQGTPTGYFELLPQDGGSIEIAYFGLMPEFIGIGLGGILLTAAVRRAWDTGAQRVWLHTCTLDHENALGNYLARGFHLFKVEEKDVEIPATAVADHFAQMKAEPSKQATPS